MNYNQEIYHSLLPIIIVNLSFVVIFMYFVLRWKHKSSAPEILARMHKSFLGVFFREFWYWLIDPMIKFLIFIKATPNSVTAFSVVLSAFTGYLFAIGQIGWAGWMVLFSGNMDLLDGRLARATGKTTKSGEFFDATMDRFNDAFVFIGVGVYFVVKGYNSITGTFVVTKFDFIMLLVTIFTIVGSAVMSYSKSRGATMGYTTKRGLMQRPERIALLTIFTVTYPFFKIVAVQYGLNPDFSLIVAMVIMATLVNFSAITRIVSIFKKIKISEQAK